MQSVSQKFKEAFNVFYRENQQLRLTIPAIDPLAADDAIVYDNGHQYFSEVAGIVYDNLPKNTYATCEKDRLVANGAQLIPPEPTDADSSIWTGFTGNLLSQADGTYLTAPTITIEFNVLRTFPAITLYFDVTTGEYPSEILVVGKRNGIEVIRIIEKPTAVVYEVIPPRTEDSRGFKNINSLEITWINSGDKRRYPRLQYLIFGYIIQFGNSELTGTAKFIDECDPITRRLPIKTASFSVLNHSGEYDVDNPDGIWPDLEERTPVKAEIGVMVSSGTTYGYVYENFRYSEAQNYTWGEWYDGEIYEWVELGNFYLDSQPRVSGRIASFSAISTLDFMSEEYYRGKFGTYSLYDIALDILQTSTIPKLSDGSNPWKIWDGLKAIYTNVPCPVVSQKEALQMVANAGCCILFVDRKGYINIKPIESIQHDDKISYDATYGLHDISPDKTCRGVRCEISKHVAPNDDIVNIVDDVFMVEAGKTLHIGFGQNYVDVSVSASGSTYEVFASACDFIFSTSGEKHIRITGKRTESITTEIIDEVENSRDTAIWATISNALISSAQMAQNVAGWVKSYLLRRKVYENTYRVFPWFDATDLIYLDSTFKNDMPVYLLRHEITFNGGFSGSFVAKRAD